MKSYLFFSFFYSRGLPSTFSKGPRQDDTKRRLPIDKVVGSQLIVMHVHTIHEEDEEKILNTRSIMYMVLCSHKEVKEGHTSFILPILNLSSLASNKDFGQESQTLTPA